MSTRNDLKDALDAAGRTFSELRDTAKLKAHLFRMETKESAPELDDFLSEIEDSLKRAASELEREGEEARLKAALGAMEARDRWDALRAELEPTLQTLRDGGNRLLDESRLREAFQKLDDQLSRNERRSEAKAWAERAGEPRQEEPEFLTQMKGAARDFVERLRTL